jgi:CRISPR-associated endonuclease Cas2
MREKTKEKVISIGKDILIGIGMLGIVPVAIGMGNAVQLLKYTPLGGKKTKYKTYQVNRSVKKLLERNLLQITEDKHNKCLKLSAKGKKLLIKYELEGLAQDKPKKWDKKYRVVIFDISEKRRKVRDNLRNILRSFGFVQLQGSVWIYPYHCQEIIELLKKYLELKQEVIYMTVDSVENDEWLLENFKLK